MGKIVLLFALLFSTLAAAGEREEKIRQLMEAQGLLQTFEQQLELSRQQNQQQGRDMLNQFMAQLNPTPEFYERFENAFNSFMSKIETPWSAEEIVEVWAKYYGEHFSNAELDQLLSHYSSPLAQKEVIASRKALVSFSNHFMQEGKPIAENALSEFITEMKVIAKECKCKR
ncbi:MAG: DUF2059 domain-containing protein [Candidatus Thiodiazotropha sp. (ex Codakia rugifera)]|nr:DUF2059 domain-containing protein [Candidatus Thiodiazotropha sp. (ex Codakia rugifera)]